MKFQQASILGLLPLSHAADTVVGVYMFHRHGDRTPKILPPANLTDLGYNEVFLSGKYYRSRYLSASSSRKIMGISSDVVNELQIAASAPLDPVLQNSAQGFLQGFYPPVGTVDSSEVLANGSTSSAPMGGYQLIPVNLVESGTGSENSGWLQDSTGCYNAEISSNNYFFTPQYNELLESTTGFYKSLLPAIKGVFNSSTASYKNAYTIYDYLNVAKIHNTSTQTKNLISQINWQKLQVLANTHEYNLAYNSSDTIRAVAGSQLAAEIVDFFEENIETAGATKFGIQFGSYGTFYSFFGLAQLPGPGRYNDFYGVADYASAMSFELYTTEQFDTYPTEDQLNIRFYYHNGTTNSISPPQPYGLFGDRSKMSMSYSDFKMQMHKFSIGTTGAWCHACGNTTGTCLPYSARYHNAVESMESSENGSGLSNAVCGVIGAMVTLAVILLIEGAIFLIGGFTIVKKNRLLAGKNVANGNSSP